MKILYGCENLDIKPKIKSYLLKLTKKLMFDLKELQLMFFDPTDLIIKNINKILKNNKTIKSIFS